MLQVKQYLKILLLDGFLAKGVEVLFSCDEEKRKGGAGGHEETLDDKGGNVLEATFCEDENSPREPEAEQVDEEEV